MKIFIVFAGLLLINMCAVSFQEDMTKYVRLQRVLANIAAECAEVAAETEAIKAETFAAALLAYTMNNLRGINVRNETCVISYGDDFVAVRIEAEAFGLFKFLKASGLRAFNESRHALKTPEESELPEEPEFYED